MTNRYKNYKVDAKNFEDGYIEYISKAYNDFLNTHRDRYRGIDFQEPEFMQSEWFAFNKKFIKNSETLNNIEESEENMKLFKIFLATLNKKKDASKFAHHILTQKYIDQQNVLVDLISSSISNSIAYQVEESFFTLEKKNQEIFEREDFIVSEARLDTSVNGLVVFWNDFFSSSRQKKRQKSVTEGESFNLVLGKFQPFHKGHLSLIESLVKNNKKKVILGLLCRNKGKKYFNEKTLQEMLNLIKEQYPDKIENVIVLNSLNLQKNLKKIQEKYTIDSLGCSDSRIVDYEIQCKKINEDSEGINLYKSKISANTAKTSSLREAILENNYSEFKKNTPECLHSYFQKLHQELKAND